MSVALPGSIVANAQSRELRTYLMGQIARSLAIFNIDEVVVYDDRSVAAEDVSGKRRPYGDPCTLWRACCSTWRPAGKPRHKPDRLCLVASRCDPLEWLAGLHFVLTTLRLPPTPSARCLSPCLPAASPTPSGPAPPRPPREL